MKRPNELRIPAALTWTLLQVGAGLVTSCGTGTSASPAMSECTDAGANTTDVGVDVDAACEGPPTDV